MYLEQGDYFSAPLFASISHSESNASLKTLEICEVAVNVKFVKLDDGSIVDLIAIPDRDFALDAAI